MNIISTMPNATKPPDRRRRELARIHIGAKALGLDRDGYEVMLWTVARVKSAADLDERGRRAVLAHLTAVGFRARPGGRTHPGRPHNIESGDRGPMLKKIEALLADAGRPWAYADAMARRMCHVERVAFCDLAQLRKLVSALVYAAKRRHGRAT